MAIVFIVLLIVLILTTVFAPVGPASTATGDDAAPMSRTSRAWLTFYFLFLAVTLLYLLIRLYSVDFPESVLALNAPGGTPDVKALSASDGPVLFYAFPHVKPGPATASGPTYELALYGDHFKENTKVRLNGQERPVKTLLDDNLIRVAPESGDVEGVGSLAIEVANPDGKISNTVHVGITRPRMPVNFIIGDWLVTRETQLILLVLAAGALGSFVHALKSLADFIGNRTAEASWYWWYVSRPFLGSTLALIFYAVLRGGFLTGTPADVRVVNPFGAVAVAALVGMFSDKAIHKLAEVFETLFKADDKRSGKLAGPVVNKLTPSTVLAGTQAAVAVTISGERLANASAVRVNGVDRVPEKVADKQVVVNLLPSDFGKPGTIPINVVTPAGMSPSATLHVSTLAITTQTLSPRVVGSQYSEKLTATGGTPPYTWKVEGLPEGLAVNKKNDIEGTPTTAGPTDVELIVTDKDGASQSKSVTLP